MAAPQARRDIPQDGLEADLLAALSSPAALLDAERRVVIANDSWLRGGGSAPSERYVPSALDECSPLDAGLLVTRVAGSDTLTGLANRSLFLERLSAAVDRGTPLAVFFLDLDGFKLVNDGWGHAAGDTLLIEVAARLHTAVRPGDLVARLGGDEFTVLCEGIGDVEEALPVAERLRRALHEPFSIAGRLRHVRASIGCRVAEGGEGAEALLRDADVAMYQAKDNGKNRVELYSAATRERLLRRLEIEQELRAALEAGALEVHYQPQVDLVSGAVVGVEALARWNHPRLGAIAPVEFVAVAEETGLIGPLGAFVLETTCRQLAAWHADGLPLTATINVSLHELADPNFADAVTGAVRRAGIDPRRVCLELTESTLMDADEVPLKVLAELMRLGVYVAIDDFGTGVSSLAALKHLPVEVLKVDRSFVDGLGTDPEDSAIVASIMSLAHAMGLHVVAEGVENPLQASQLIALGCTVAQGFLWSKAVPAGEIGAIAQGLPAAGLVGDESVRFGGERSFIDEMLHQIGIPKEEL